MESARGFRFEYAPDFKKISQLMCETWDKPCWNYDEGLLALHIDRPTGDKELTVSQISEDGRTASFQAYMPFEISYYGKNYKAVFGSFFTIAPLFQGRGLGNPLQVELINKSIEKNYDLFATMCEVGSVSNRILKIVFRKMKLPIKVVHVCRYIAALNDHIKPVLPQVSSGNTRLVTHSDLADLKPLIQSIGKNTNLHKIIPDEDISFLFIDRPHCKTYLYKKNDKVQGFINLLLLEVLESDTEKKLNIYFENVSFGSMTEVEKEEFLGDTLLDLQKEKFYTALIPNNGYVDTAVFKKFRFRLAPRELNLYLAPLREGVLPDGIKEVDSFFMDVY